MDKYSEIKYVITNEKEDKFFKSLEFYVTNPQLADHFALEKIAGYYLDKILNDFHSKIFTKIIRIVITIIKIEDR